MKKKFPVNQNDWFFWRTLIAFILALLIAGAIAIYKTWTRYIQPPKTSSYLTQEERGQKFLEELIGFRNKNPAEGITPWTKGYMRSAPRRRPHFLLSN